MSSAGPGSCSQDFLNGSLLGHSLHAVLVDVVDRRRDVVALPRRARDVISGWRASTSASLWGLGLVVLSAVGAILSGLTDYKDTLAQQRRARRGRPSTASSTSSPPSALGISVAVRTGGGDDAGFWVLLVWYLVVSVGSYIGGHIVFKYGYMVNFNAFSKGRRAKQFTAVAPVADVPEGVADQGDVRTRPR